MKMPSQRFRRNIWPAVLLAALSALFASPGRADNPIVQTNYTADPAPLVHDGRLYVYTSHDEDVTVGGFFTMNDWRVYSTIDMVNWTDHGSPASYKSFSWGTGDAWAPHVATRGGKFFLYVPLNNSTGARIGVGVSNSPIGPFTDALGRALINGGTGTIDPTVFIDDDEQAYMYWGNPDLFYVKLNADMTSYQGSPTKVELTTAGFGTRSNTMRPTAYEEGPWFYKRGSLYYLVYPADGTPEKISYSTASGPLGPWTYRGDIMAKQTGAGSSFTNHPGIVDYKGKSYFFYHNGALPGGGGYKRSVCVEEFAYGADGSIPTITMSSGGPAPVATLNPFVQVEAETIAFSTGLKTEVCTDTGGGMNVTAIDDGDYIKVRNVDFVEGVTSFEARVSAASSEARIEVRLDAQNGTLLGTCDVSGAAAWTTKTCPVSGESGKHDLFLKFTGGSGALFKFNWWRFVGPRMPDGSGGAGGMSGAGGTGAGSGGAAGMTGGTGMAAGGAGAAASGGTSGGVTAVNGGAPGSSGASMGGVAGDASPGGATSGSAGASAGMAASGAPSGGAAPSGSAGTTSAGTDAAGVDGADSGGCSCRAGSRAGALAPWTSLLLLALAFRRRSARRRRRAGARDCAG